jgi:hypothetical protein
MACTITCGAPVSSGDGAAVSVPLYAIDRRPANAFAISYALRKRLCWRGRCAGGDCLRSIGLLL